MSKLNVVIVGGGSAGIGTFTGLTAKLDKAKYNLILLSARDYSVWLPALPRLVVHDQPEVEKYAVLPYDKLTANDTLKIGTVAAIEEGAPGEGGSVVLESGEKLPYAVLVLAPGSIWEGPLNLPQEKGKVPEHLQLWRERFAAAKDIVVAGGGAVGTELAGEIKDLSTSKKVTIVQGAPGLLNDTYPEKFRGGIARQLSGRGVNLVYNDFIDTFPEPGTVGITTRNGTHFDADLVVPTRGGRPNTKFVATLGEGVLTASGHVKTEATLQVKGHPDVFAAGDVLDWKEQKQAAKTQNHAAVVVANVLARLAKQTPSKAYKGSSEILLLTNGKGGGLAYFGILWGILFGSWFARLIKSKTVLVSLHKGALKY